MNEIEGQWTIAAARPALRCAAGGAGAQQKELKIGYQPNPHSGRVDRHVREMGRQEQRQDRQGAELLRRLRREDDGLAHLGLGPVRRHLAQRRLGPALGTSARADRRHHGPGKFADKWGMDKVIFSNEQGQTTVVPMGQTFGVVLLPHRPGQGERSAQDLGRHGDDQQEAAGRGQGQVRLCRRHGDEQHLVHLVLVDVDQQLRRADAVLQRDNKVLAQNGWKSSADQPCMQQTAEFWWDAINTYKISPRGMPAYDRNEANAVFMAGDAAFTVADSTVLGHVQRSGQVEDRRQGRHRAFPARAQPQAKELRLGRHLGLGDPEGDPARAQEAGQGNAGAP